MNDVTTEYREPWLNDPEMESALEDAGWRYMAIANIVSGSEHNDQCVEDIKKYAHFRKVSDEMPEYVDEDAISFMKDITGYSALICLSWMMYDWAEEYKHDYRSFDEILSAVEIKLDD